MSTNTPTDVRLIERGLRKGTLNEADVDAKLSTLPDTIDKALVIETNEAPDPSQFVSQR